MEVLNKVKAWAGALADCINVPNKPNKTMLVHHFQNAIVKILMLT